MARNSHGIDRIAEVDAPELVKVRRAQGQVVLPEPIRKPGVKREICRAKAKAEGEEDMMQTAQSIVVFSAALGLLALTETAGDAAFSVESQFPTIQYGAPRVSTRVEVRRATDGSPVLVRVNSPQSEDVTDAYPPFTCAQLQIIDEVGFKNAGRAAHGVSDLEGKF